MEKTDKNQTETLKKKIKEEEKERLERERTEKQLHCVKNARIPHYGVISTNKNIVGKVFLLRKMSTGTSTMSNANGLLKN